MDRRREKDYDSVFTALKRVGLTYKFSLQPEMVMTDFEKAAINSFQMNFPGAEMKGTIIILNTFY
jgi:hypothetical protein